jgi:hypothetical protein
VPDRRLGLPVNLENRRCNAPGAVIGAVPLRVVARVPVRSRTTVSPVSDDRHSLYLSSMTKFSIAAQMFADSFSQQSRNDKSSYWICNGPEWIKTAVMLSHNGEMPNDTRYALIRDAVTAIAENLYDDADDAREDLYDLAVQLAPTYTGELLSWFADHPSRLSDCDDAMEESGTGSLSQGIYEALLDGYCHAAREVLSTLITEIEENAGSIFNPDTDCRLILSDSHGVYIPKLYCESLTEEDAEDLSVNWEDIKTCQSGPDADFYWEAWQSICDDARIVDNNGDEWRLCQSGDLWEIRADVEIPEEWF